MVHQNDDGKKGTQPCWFLFCLFVCKRKKRPWHIWPFFSLLLACRLFSEASSAHQIRTTFYLFWFICWFFDFCFCFSNDDDDEQDSCLFLFSNKLINFFIIIKIIFFLTDSRIYLSELWFVFVFLHSVCLYLSLVFYLDDVEWWEWIFPFVHHWMDDSCVQFSQRRIAKTWTNIWWLEVF